MAEQRLRRAEADGAPPGAITVADEVQVRIDGPMMTGGTAAWGAREAERVKASQQRLSDAVGNLGHCDSCVRTWSQPGKAKRQGP